MNIILANCCAVISALFLVASVYMHTKRRMVLTQLGCNICDIAAESFVWSFPGMVIGVLALIRNLVCAKQGLYNKLWWLFVLTNTVIGLAVNNVGVAGYVGVVATVQWSVWLYLAKTPQLMRLGTLINLAIWCVYEIMLNLYAYFVLLCVQMAITAVTMYRYRHGEPAPKI